MLSPPCTSILCLFSLVALTPDWTLTLILFLAPHHLAHGSPTHHSLPQGLSWGCPHSPL